MKNSSLLYGSSKIARVLAHLVYEGALNRFEAERIGDHCLNSTISTLANRYGVMFERTPEVVPNNWSEPCEVTRYRIAGLFKQQAECVLAKLLKRPSENHA